MDDTTKGDNIHGWCDGGSGVATVLSCKTGPSVVTCNGVTTGIVGCVICEFYRP